MSVQHNIYIIICNVYIHNYKREFILALAGILIHTYSQSDITACLMLILDPGNYTWFLFQQFWRCFGLKRSILSQNRLEMP